MGQLEDFFFFFEKLKKKKKKLAGFSRVSRVTANKQFFFNALSQELLAQ